MNAATCETLDAANLRALPNAAALVIDGGGGPERADDIARRARATGFSGAITLVGDDAGASLSQMGVVAVRPDRLAHDLVPAIADALARSGLPLAEQVMRARRLVAAGEIALHLQHDINNPLAGLLAELQLMQMDTLPQNHVEAVERMIELCRRLITLTRRLDGVGERKS
jgi:signal transduction histidine kinase